MSNYRRPWIPGAAYFITIVTNDRIPLLIGPTIDMWREALAAVRIDKPFKVEAAVVLPDHTHLLVRLPTGDSDISSRLGQAKATFTKSMRAKGESEAHVTASRYRHRDGGYWQRRFYDRFSETKVITHYELITFITTR